MASLPLQLPHGHRPSAQGPHPGVCLVAGGGHHCHGTWWCSPGIIFGDLSEMLVNCFPIILKFVYVYQPGSWHTSLFKSKKIGISPIQDEISF